MASQSPPPPYGQPQPGYGEPQPGYGQPQPGYGQPQHGYANPQDQSAMYNPGKANVDLQPPAPQVVYVQQSESMPSMAGHIALSCVVFWCCNCLFGCIAFFIAIAGLSANSPDEAKKLGKSSLWVNVSGIIISTIFIIIILVLYFTGTIYIYSY